MTPEVQHILLLVGFFAVAVGYSAVGHGGASGYLAVMAFTAMSTKDSSTLSLAMNIVVSLIAFLLFRRAKHFDWQLTWPFLLGSVPMAYLGGRVKLSDNLHQWVLAVVLLYAGITLLVRKPSASEVLKEPPIVWRILSGAGIGLLSGMVGVGGGIFLSPLIVLLKWTDVKKTASISALFIFFNSIAGLIARGASSLPIIQNHADTLVVASVGALLGAWFGSHKVQDLGLKRLLGVVLLFAVIKLIVR